MSGKAEGDLKQTGGDFVNVAIPGPERLSTQKESKNGVDRCCLVLVGLAILLFMAAATAAVVYFVVLKDYDDDNVRKVGTDRNGTSYGTKEDPDRDIASNKTAAEYHRIAAIIAQKMDPSVDPCENFAEYACGGFYREATVPGHQLKTGTFVDANDDNYELVRDIIEEEVSSDDPEYLVKIKDCYWSCMNEETVGIEHFLNTSFPSMWPTLNPTWDPASFNINETMIEYAKYDVTPFLSIDVGPNLYDSSQQAIYFSSRIQFLIWSDDLLGPRNGSVLLAFENFLVQMAVEVGAVPEVAREDVQESVDFLIRLVYAIYGSRFRRSQIDVDTLETVIPQFDFRGVLQAKFDKTGIQLSGDETVLLRRPASYPVLSNIIDETSPRVVQNFFAMSHALMYLDGLTERLRDMRHDLDRVARGYRMDDPLWYHCLLAIAPAMWKGVGKEFVKKRLSSTNEQDIIAAMNEMMDSVADEFSEILDHTGWLSFSTKLVAKEKLAKMGRKLGFPHENFAESDINYLYRDISFSKDNFFENRRILTRFSLSSNLKRIAEEVDDSRWKTPLIVANAFYNNYRNQIVIPLGLIPPTFFSYDYPESVKYGRVASIIGHEIIHGFDDNGYLFDADGSYFDWMPVYDRLVFTDKLDCVVDQYNSFVHPQVNLSLNGDNMIGEAVADLSGNKIAFRAFKKKYEASPIKELPLPDLGLTPYQQYFLTAAQWFCQKHTDEWLTSFMPVTAHPPGRFRIIGTFQNNEDFAEAFNCRPGSYMNPRDKCVVW